MAPPWVRASSLPSHKFVQILADGLRRDVEAHCEIVDDDTARLPGERQNLLLTGAYDLHQGSTASAIAAAIQV